MRRFKELGATMKPFFILWNFNPFESKWEKTFN